MKKVKLIKHLSDQDLLIRYEEDFSKKVRKRWHLLWLIQSQGYTIEQASIAVGHSRTWGQPWVKQYNKKGPIAIVEPKKRNPNLGKVKVTEQMKLDLFERLDSNPPDKIGGGLWSGPKVMLFLKVFYQVDICRYKGWQLLKECGYSVTTIRPKHHKSSKEKKDFFKTE